MKEKLLCAVFLQFVHTCRRYLVNGVLYKILDFVGSNYLERDVQ